MNKELDQLLCERYPTLFSDRGKSAQESAMCFGFSCDDGWFVLLDVLSTEITRRAQGCSLDVRALQVKEKFGSLRFYEAGGDAYVHGLTWAAGLLSERLCEECGAPAYLSPQGWCRTRCIEHGGPATPPEGKRMSVRGRITKEGVWVGPAGFGTDTDAQDAQAITPRVPSIKNRGWWHLAETLEVLLDNAIHQNGATEIVIEEVIETDVLTFRWRTDGLDEQVSAFFRMIETLSARTDRETGLPAKGCPR